MGIFTYHVQDKQYSPDEVLGILNSDHKHIALASASGKGKFYSVGTALEAFASIEPDELSSHSSKKHFGLSDVAKESYSGKEITLMLNAIQKLGVFHTFDQEYGIISDFLEGGYEQSTDLIPTQKDAGLFSGPAAVLDVLVTEDTPSEHF